MDFQLQISLFLSYELWKQRYELWKLINQTPPCLDFCFSSLTTPHSSLKIKYPFGTIIHFSSLNIFHTICGPHACHRVRPKLFCSCGRLLSPFFSLFSFLISPYPFSPVTLPKHKPKPIKISQALQRGSDNVISFVKAQRRRRSVKKHKPSNSHLLL